MKQNEFKITMSHKGTFSFIVIFAVIEAGLIATIFYDDLKLLGVVFSAALFIICFLAEFTSYLYKVQVIDSNIRMRTKCGKKFSFTLSEITKITCGTQYRAKFAQVECITIKTSSFKVEVEQTMNGFQNMAIYLLENLENGEINNNAASSSCKRKLNQYKKDKNYRYKGEEDDN